MTPLRQRMIEDMRVRNFAPGTQSTYVRHVSRFAQHFGKSPEFLGLEELRAYQVYLVQEKQVSWSIFNTVVCALRFLYRIT
jgi:integrase/recombinase XerD